MNGKLRKPRLLTEFYTGPRPRQSGTGRPYESNYTRHRAYTFHIKCILLLSSQSWVMFEFFFYNTDAVTL